MATPNPLTSFFEGFQGAQQRAVQQAQQMEENALTRQLREIQMLNAQRQMAELAKTPEQRAQEAIAAQLITQAISRGGVQAAPAGLAGESIALPRALPVFSQELLETGAITPQQAISDAITGPVQFETPVPGTAGAFTENPILAAQAEKERISRLGLEASARRAPLPQGFQLFTDDLGNQRLIQVRGSGAGTGISSAVTTPTGEQVKAAPKAATGSRSILAEDQNGRLTNVVLAPGGSLPEGFKEHVKPKVGAGDADSLRKEFNGLQVVKDFREVSPQYTRMQQALEESKKGGSLTAVDQTLINTFNKILDPKSVVRESEYARTAADQSVIDYLKGKLDPDTGKIVVGGAGLSNQNRQAMLRMAERFYNTSRSNFDQTAKFYEDIAINTGRDPSLVIQGIEDIRERLEAPNVPRGTTEVPLVTTQEQFDALPKGARFQEDGKFYTKP